MPKLILTKEEINEIISLYLNGIKQSEIAKMYNVSDTTIMRKLKENDVKKNNKSFSEEEEKQIIEYFRATNNVSKTADTFSVQPTNIIPILKKYNIIIPSLSDARRKYTLDESYFHNIDNQNKAYILGFFYADGSVGSTDYSVTINLNEKDKYILESMNKQFKNTKPLGYTPISIKYRRPNPQYRIQIYSKEMHNDLVDKGVLPNKSLIIKYPTFLPDSLQSHFLRGVFDGDGCITRTKRKSNYIISVSIMGTYDFCLGAKEICNRLLGINPHIYLRGCNEVTSELYIRKKEDIKVFLNWLYKDAEMFLIRKYNRYIDYFNISESNIA